MRVAPICSCYVDNCRTDADRHRVQVTTVVECPKHSTRALQELLRRGRACAQERRTGETYGHR